MNYNNYFPIVEYYKKVVTPLNYSRYKVKSDKMFVCPLHDDHDPSLGLVKSEKGDLVHCFGCGFWGDVVKFHIKLQKKYQKRDIDEETAVNELCKIFNLDSNKVPKPNSSKSDCDGGAKQETALNDAIECFDIGDLYNLIQEGKRKKKPIGYFNAVVMTMLDSCKGNE